MSDKPNCSTCDHKDNDWCEDLNRILTWHEKSLISEVGCMLHPQAREYLMKEVIAELERRINSCQDNLMENAFCYAYNEAINLIRGKGGVK